MNLDEFRLKYICKTTGKVMRARMKGLGRILLVDPDTSETEELSVYAARKKYRCSRDNVKVKHKLAEQKIKRLGKMLYTKEYRQYLEGEKKIS